MNTSSTSNVQKQHKYLNCFNSIFQHNFTNSIVKLLKLSIRALNILGFILTHKHTFRELHYFQNLLVLTILKKRNEEKKNSSFRDLHKDIPKLRVL